MMSTHQQISGATGGSSLLIYHSQFAGTNKATAVTWNVGERVVALVRDLEAKGVRFERYDMPNTKHEGSADVRRDSNPDAHC